MKEIEIDASVIEKRCAAEVFDSSEVLFRTRPDISLHIQAGAMRALTYLLFSETMSSTCSAGENRSRTCEILFF